MKSKEEIEKSARIYENYRNDSSELAQAESGGQYHGYKKGYNDCLKDMADKKYTEEDILGFLNFYNEFDFNKLGYRYRHPSMDGSEKKYNQDIHKKIIKQFIESLNKQD